MATCESCGMRAECQQLERYADVDVVGAWACYKCRNHIGSGQCYRQIRARRYAAAQPAQQTPGGSAPAHRKVSDSEQSDVTTAAQPPGPSLCWEHGGPYVGACPGCVWDKEMRHDGRVKSICVDVALEEVERQVALVARLEFDLKMLRLLGQGWSRGDLLARAKPRRSGL